MRSGWNCDGDGLRGYAPAQGTNATSDPTACCELCSRVSECQVWTIYSDHCFLKSANCTMIPHTTSISGGATPAAPPAPPAPYPCPPPPPAVPDTWATHAVGKWHVRASALCLCTLFWRAESFLFHFAARVLAMGVHTNVPWVRQLPRVLHRR